MFFDGRAYLTSWIPERFKRPARFVVLQPVVETIHSAFDVLRSVSGITHPGSDQAQVNSRQMIVPINGQGSFQGLASVRHTARVVLSASDIVPYSLPVQFRFEDIIGVALSSALKIGQSLFIVLGDKGPPPGCELSRDPERITSRKKNTTMRIVSIFLPTIRCADELHALFNNSAAEICNLGNRA